MANVVDLLLCHGKHDDPALLIGPRTIAFAELRDAVAKAARSVLDASSPGDRIAILAENGLDFVAAYLGIIASGRVAVPMPVTAEAHEVRGWQARFGIRAAFCDERRVQTLTEAGVVRLAPAHAGAPARYDAEAHTPAAIMLTSGSTGEAKGVVVSHGNLTANTADIADYLELTPADRCMVVLPFSYCYGLSLLHTHLARGGSLVLNNGFLFVERVLDEIARTRCTGLAGVPATYQILLRRSTFLQRELRTVRTLQQAGGPLPRESILEIARALPWARFFTMYGQTEATARLSYLPPERLADKLGSIGRGLCSTRLEVLREDGSAVSAGSDEVGEVVASGPAIALGYWNDPEESARYFRGGRLFTGDLARVDADGFIFLVDRSRDFLKVMGVRISPSEIEAVIAGMPEIAEVAVVGVPDEESGEAVLAAVVPTRAGSCEPEAVRDFCNARLPNVKVPKHVVVLDALPRTANGKIAKPALRRLSS
jgi:long-chain acyl-CoA synthetase